jgi:hypothetical protein
VGETHCWSAGQILTRIAWKRSSGRDTKSTQGQWGRYRDLTDHTSVPTTDVVLIGNDLSRFVDTARLSRHMRRIILQNFGGTIAVDIVEIGLAAVGFLNPLLAAFIHVTSELAFILNSTRLLPRAR